MRRSMLLGMLPMVELGWVATVAGVGGGSYAGLVSSVAPVAHLVALEGAGVPRVALVRHARAVAPAAAGVWSAAWWMRAHGSASLARAASPLS